MPPSRGRVGSARRGPAAPAHPHPFSGLYESYLDVRHDLAPIPGEERTIRSSRERRQDRPRRHRPPRQRRLRPRLPGSVSGLRYPCALSIHLLLIAESCANTFRGAGGGGGHFKSAKSTTTQTACADLSAHGNAPVSVREVTGVVRASQGGCPQAGSARPVRADAGLPRRRLGRLTRS